MEQNGYTEESYEAWRDNASEGVGIPDMELQGVDELVEKKLLLGVLADAMDSLLPEERELAMKVFGEEMSLADYADMKKRILGRFQTINGEYYPSCGGFSRSVVLRLTADDHICQQEYFCDKFYGKCRTVFKKISF